MKIHLAMFFPGDFNAHCQNWWPGGDTKKEGIAIDNLTPTLVLSQLIGEATNFETNENPTCIDLIFCDQPNLITQRVVSDHHLTISVNTS